MSFCSSLHGGSPLLLHGVGLRSHCIGMLRFSPAFFLCLEPMVSGSVPSSFSIDTFVLVTFKKVSEEVNFLRLSVLLKLSFFLS